MVETYSKLVDIAYNMHISGKLEEAKSVYEKLLSINAGDLDVKNLYAQLNVSLMNYDTALELFKEVYSKTKLDDILINIAKVYMHKNEYLEAIQILDNLKIKDISVLKLIALSYLKVSDYSKSIEMYNTIILMEKASFSDYFNLSIAYLNLNKLNEALDSAYKAYDLQKDDIQINMHIASIFEELSNFESAIKHLEFVCSKSIDIKIIYHIGMLYEKIGNDEQAVAYFNEILNIEPNNKDALLKIAIIYKNYDKNVTVEILNKLLNLYTDDVSLLGYLYTIYSQMELNFEALQVALKLIQYDDKNYAYYTFAGDSYLNCYDYENAELMYKKALSIIPDDEYAVSQLGRSYSAQNKLDLAVELLKKYPEYKSAREELIFVQCKNKNFLQVKDDYYDFQIKIKDKTLMEDKVKKLFYKYNLDKKYDISENEFINLKSIKKTSISDFAESYLKKDCKGNYIKNKRLLIYSINGVGDLIMVSRYLNELSSYVSKIVMQIPASCLSFFKYNFPNIKFYTEEAIVPKSEYDYSIPTLCLFYLVNQDFNNISFKSSYLSVSDEIVCERKLNFTNKKVGIYWQGNPTLLPNRAIPLDELLPLFELKNINFFSFQIDKNDYESAKLESLSSVVDLSTTIKNYEDTASYLKNIDILITIDSSIAHLAGSLGIKTYLLLPYDSEWRWFNDTETTPWYNSIKIFKQIEPNNWNEVIERVKKELQN